MKNLWTNKTIKQQPKWVNKNQFKQIIHQLHDYPNLVSFLESYYENLDSDEYALYVNVFKHLTVDAPIPNLVIYLQAPTEILIDRIQKRGIPAEQFIEREYIENLSAAYTEFFHYYTKSPLLIINTSEINLVSDDQDYQHLVEYIASNPTGTNFLNPSLSFI